MKARDNILTVKRLKEILKDQNDDNIVTIFNFSISERFVLEVEDVDTNVRDCFEFNFDEEG